MLKAITSLIRPNCSARCVFDSIKHCKIRAVEDFKASFSSYSSWEKIKVSGPIRVLLSTSFELFDSISLGKIRTPPFHFSLEKLEMILTLLSWLGSGIGFVFMTYSLATGLYYISELVEEYSVLSKRIINYTLVVTYG